MCIRDRVYGVSVYHDITKVRSRNEPTDCNLVSVQETWMPNSEKLWLKLDRQLVASDASLTKTSMSSARLIRNIVAELQSASFSCFSAQLLALNYIETSGHATWYTAGGAIRMAYYDVIDDVIIWVQDGNCKKMARENFSIGAFYNITKNQDNPIKTVGRDSFLSPKTPKNTSF